MRRRCADNRQLSAGIGLALLALLLGGCAQPPKPAPSPTPIPLSAIGMRLPTVVPAPKATPTAAAARNTSPTATARPIISSPTPSTMQVKVYYTRVQQNDVQFVQVERTVPRTAAVGTAALEELLKGTTPAEKAEGLDNPIPEKARLLSLRIADGVAHADFNEALQAQVGGSLRVAAIRNSITLTLLQFPTVKKVVISIAGRTEDILQP